MGRLKKVYAYQIKENKKYKGRYIILIKQPKNDYTFSNNFYKVKLTKDNILPKNKEEINSCEFVKMRMCPYELRVFPINGVKSYSEALAECKETAIPDIDNNLYGYDYEFMFTKKENKSSLIYLGEFDVNNNPPHERKTMNSYMPVYGFISKLEIQVIESYEDNNLKKASIYNKIEREEYVNSSIATVNELKEWMANYNSELYNYSFGYKLLDSDVTNMAITDYKKCYSKNKTSKAIINDVMLEGKDCLNNKADSSLYIFGIAYEIMKHKREMPISFKKKVYSAIKKDLKYWTNNELYEKRKEELETFRSKVEKYQVIE